MTPKSSKYIALQTASFLSHTRNLDIVRKEAKPMQWFQSSSVALRELGQLRKKMARVKSP
jgi:hypothetical protein